MEPGLTIYKSSAGSGKTYTLVREYLALVLERPSEYKHILAITFTNKATEEMKQRIVDSLAGLARDEKKSLKEELQKLLPSVNIQINAQRALDYILHDYSRFHVSTIDSFFQQIIRSLARELHLPARFDVEMDQEQVVDDIIHDLLEEAGKDADLTKWLEELILMKMNDDKGWRIEDDIKWVANELFTENFPQHAVDINRNVLWDAIKKMRAIHSDFIHKMETYGKEAIKIIAQHGLSETDFYYGKKGIYGYLEMLNRKHSAADAYIPNSYVNKVWSGEASWSSAKTANAEIIERLASGRLGEILHGVFDLMKSSFTDFATAQQSLRYIYISGIISDLSRKLASYRDDNGLMFISDAPKILSTLAGSDDTSFIYEKFGIQLHHFLVDEFQDTSTLQWKNILPLITESLGSGNYSLVVGDAKQSIYRWRGGNMHLLGNLKNELSAFRNMIKELNLDTNYRSRKLIVDFNNDFFMRAAELLSRRIHSDATEADDSNTIAAYKPGEIKQLTAPQNVEGGFIRAKFFESEQGSDDPALKWKGKALSELLSTINNVLSMGYEAKDIAILVRKNTHGNDIALHLFDNGIKNIVSPDSLLLDSSPKIDFLLSALRFLSDQSDDLAKAEIMHYYICSRLGKENEHEIFSLHKKKKKEGQHTEAQPLLFEESQLANDIFNRCLPPEFTQHLFYLSKLPLYELSEQMIGIFGLNKEPDAYLQRFQDIVLEQTLKHNLSIRAFLEWWEEHKHNLSIIVPEDENAITIMTIHKSKGLQFPIVIIPWMEWTLGTNPNDLLWVRSDEEPYNQLGLIPVKPAKALMHTSFREQYEDEITANYIDNLNLMYVAMTRAEQQLYIFSENSKSKDYKNVSNIVNKVMADSPVLKLKETANSITYEAGELKSPGMKKPAKETKQLNSYIISRWQEKITISSKAAELQRMINPASREKIDFGILVHRALSEISNKREIDSVIESIVGEGIINKEEATKLHSEVLNYFAIEGIEQFYNEEWKTLNERQILLPGGEILRPDRVLIKENAAIIIDFKTGKEEKSHRKQLMRYSETLQSMGYHHVKSYIIYINEKRIAEVTVTELTAGN